MALVYETFRVFADSETLGNTLKSVFPTSCILDDYLILRVGIKGTLLLSAYGKTERPMTTALFMLRCVQLGLSIADLDLLTIGLVNEMFNESGRDGIEWREEAYQSDMDRV